MRNTISTISLIIITAMGYTQTTLLNEGFQNGIPTTWSVVDLDGEVPDSSISYITEAWVGYESVFDTCAISTSFYQNDSNEVKQSSDFLITPKLNLQSFGHILSWQSKSFDANYPESYYVLLSSTDSLPGSFTDTIKFVSNDSPNWKTFSYNIFNDGFANQPVYVAFVNVSISKFILGIDNVKLTTDDVASTKQAIQNQFVVYPNPIVNNLHSNIANGTAYEVITTGGKTILQGQTNSKGIDFKYLDSGVYFVRFRTDNGYYVKKILKQGW